MFNPFNLNFPAFRCQRPILQAWIIILLLLTLTCAVSAHANLFVPKAMLLSRPSNPLKPVFILIWICRLFPPYRILLILIHLIGFSQSIFAQTITGPGLDDPYARPVTFQEEDYVTLTNTIKKRLAQEHGDTSQFYVAQSIVEFCGDDYDCLMNLHHRLRDLMFENHHYLVALALARASVSLAAQNNDPFNAGLAYVDMSFYYNDLGRVDSFVATLEKALPYFEKCGACFRIFKVRQELLERKYGDQPKVIVPLIEKNLEDARNMHCDIPSIQHNLKRLTVYTENGGMWDKFEKYLTALEQTLVPVPTTFEARKRLSPEISWYLLKSNFLTVIG